MTQHFSPTAILTLAHLAHRLCPPALSTGQPHTRQSRAINDSCPLDLDLGLVRQVLLSTIQPDIFSVTTRWRQRTRRRKDAAGRREHGS